ncbi:MAG: pilus assembly protein PilM [Candidatus Sumerlaeaceae bacterium]
MAASLAIEFTDVDCKLVHVERGKGGRLTVRVMSSFELSKDENVEARVTQRAQLLRDALKAGKIKPQAVRVVIPKNFVMARTVTLPSVDENEIVGMARFEAERHIPFNADRHIVSHHTLSKQGMQGSDVLLAAVDQPIAQEYLDVCAKAGLTVEGISVSSLAVFNAFAAAEPTALAERVVAVVNIGRAGTDLVIATNGNVTFTRGSTLGLNKLLAELESAGLERPFELQDLSQVDALEPHLYFRRPGSSPAEPVPVIYDELASVHGAIPPPPPIPDGFSAVGGGQADINMSGIYRSGASSAAAEISAHLIPPSEAVAPDNPGAVAFRGWLIRVLQEVKRTYEFAHREFDIPLITHIYLAGEGTAIHNLSQYFRVNFSVEASVFDPLRGAQPTKKLPQSARDRSAAFAAAIGALVADATPHAVRVNLLPMEYLQRRLAKKQQRSYIVTGVLLLAALGMGYMYMSDKFEQKRDMLSELLDRNAKDKTRVGDLESKKQRLEIIRSNVQEDQGALEVLEKLSELSLVPSKVTLTRFEYKKGDFVKVQGHAKDLSSANQVVAELRKMQTPDGRLYFDEAKMDDNSLATRNPRGKGTDAVIEYSATATFPKKKKKTSSQSSEAAASEEGGAAGGTQ